MRVIMSMSIHLVYHNLIKEINTNHNDDDDEDSRSGGTDAEPILSKSKRAGAGRKA